MNNIKIYLMYIGLSKSVDFINQIHLLPEPPNNVSEDWNIIRFHLSSGSCSLVLVF